MSVEIRATIICDGCGPSIVGPVERSTTLGMQTYWKAKREAQKRHWMILQRYGKARHLCQACADGQNAAEQLAYKPGDYDAD